jgi:MFS transporter, DHA2 family, multidrug resistance protein
MASAAAPQQAPAMSNRRRLIIGLCLAISNFMVVLDLTIANVSIPHIAGTLGITLEQGAWIITSYAVAEAVVVPLTGWLAQRFGTVRVFIAAMLGFGLFSLLCGLSMTLGMLVVARIGQGLCGGPIMPMSQTMMMRLFPPEQRAAAMGVWAMTVILGPALGPILGGWISDNASWHWIFLINVPIAMACSAVAFFMLTPYETETERKPIDRMGLFLLVFWIGCLQIMLDTGRDHDWFGDWRIVALAILAFLGFCTFVIWELTEKHPVVDLRILRHRGLSASLAVLALAFGSFFASIVILPQWLQISQGYTATDAGLIMAIQSAASLVAAPVVAKLMQKVDPRVLLTSGLTWMGLTTLVRSTWFSGMDFHSMAWPMALQGLGVPFMMIPLTVVSLSSVRPEETASAAGLQNFMRTMAIAIATATVLTIWGDSQRVARNELVEVIRPDGAQTAMSAAGLSPEQARAFLSMMVDQEAYVMAMNHTFFLSAMLLFLAAAIVWIVPPVKPGQEMPMGH